jgi:ribose 5-phosphate isomerase B
LSAALASVAEMRIVFGTDEETSVTRSMRAHLESSGHEVVDVAGSEEWPEVGRAVGEAVASGKADRGVACCYTGTGVSIAANKVAGVRAALCADAATARGARKWNDANVLCLGLRLVSEVVAAELLDAFMQTQTDESERETVSRVEAP